MRKQLLYGYVWLIHIGWTLPASIGMLGAAALLVLFGLPSERHAVANTRAELASAQAQLARPPKPIMTPQAIAALNLSNFYRSLGGHPGIEDPIAALFEVAGKAGLALKQGEYHSTYDPNGLYYTYRITLPVQGTYGSIRQFCEEALLALPYASLDEIQFKRRAISDATIEAKLQFTLYLTDQRPADSKPPSSAPEAVGIL